MSTRKKTGLKAFVENLRRKEMKWYTARLKRKKKKQELKAELQNASHSLFWVWEFSKKAVLICFLFYIVVQVYAMTVMVVYLDFTYLGELVSQTGSILRDCVFAYLIKAGLENIGKIWFSRWSKSHPEDTSDDSGEGPVG